MVPISTEPTLADVIARHGRLPHTQQTARPEIRGAPHERDKRRRSEGHPGISAVHAAPNQRRAPSQIQPDPENVEQFALKLPGRSCTARSAAAKAARHRMGEAPRRVAYQTDEKRPQPTDRLL